MYITLTTEEVNDAMTEWLNTHRFSEPVRVIGMLLGTRLDVGSGVSNTVELNANVINLVYLRDELAGIERKGDS